MAKSLSRWDEWGTVGMGALRTVRRRLDGIVSQRETGGEYVCQSCETRYEVRYHTCPACGGYSVERIDW